MSCGVRRLLQKKIQPPFKPSVVSITPRRIILFSLIRYFTVQESVLDVANFDQEFTSEAAQDSVVQDSQLSKTVQDQFQGFTYNPADEHLSESISYANGL